MIIEGSMSKWEYIKQYVRILDNYSDEADRIQILQKWISDFQKYLFPKEKK